MPRYRSSFKLRKVIGVRLGEIISLPRKQPIRFNELVRFNKEKKFMR